MPSDEGVVLLLSDSGYEPGSTQVVAISVHGDREALLAYAAAKYARDFAQFNGNAPLRWGEGDAHTTFDFAVADYGSAHWYFHMEEAPLVDSLVTAVDLAELRNDILATMKGAQP